MLDIQLSDAQPMQLLSSKKSVEENMQAELHALHLRVEPEYAALWQQYVLSLQKKSCSAHSCPSRSPAPAVEAVGAICKKASQMCTAGMLGARTVKCGPLTGP